MRNQLSLQEQVSEIILKISEIKYISYFPSSSSCTFLFKINVLLTNKLFALNLDIINIIFTSNINKYAMAYLQNIALFVWVADKCFT